jgi:hypothetical protein
MNGAGIPAAAQVARPAMLVAPNSALAGIPLALASAAAT